MTDGELDSTIRDPRQAPPPRPPPARMIVPPPQPPPWNDPMGYEDMVRRASLDDRQERSNCGPSRVEELFSEEKESNSIMPEAFNTKERFDARRQINGLRGRVSLGALYPKTEPKTAEGDTRPFPRSGIPPKTAATTAQATGGLGATAPRRSKSQRRPESLSGIAASTQGGGTRNLGDSGGRRLPASARGADRSPSGYRPRARPSPLELPPSGPARPARADSTSADTGGSSSGATQQSSSRNGRRQVRAHKEQHKATNEDPAEKESSPSPSVAMRRRRDLARITLHRTAEIYGVSSHRPINRVNTGDRDPDLRATSTPKGDEESREANFTMQQSSPEPATGGQTSDSLPGVPNSTRGIGGGSAGGVVAAAAAVSTSAAAAVGSGAGRDQREREPEDEVGEPPPTSSQPSRSLPDATAGSCPAFAVVKDRTSGSSVGSARVRTDAESERPRDWLPAVLPDQHESQRSPMSQLSAQGDHAEETAQIAPSRKLGFFDLIEAAPKNSDAWSAFGSTLRHHDASPWPDRENPSLDQRFDASLITLDTGGGCRRGGNAPLGPLDPERAWNSGSGPLAVDGHELQPALSLYIPPELGSVQPSVLPAFPLSWAPRASNHHAADAPPRSPAAAMGHDHPCNDDALDVCAVLGAALIPSIATGSAGGATTSSCAPKESSSRSSSSHGQSRPQRRTGAPPPGDEASGTEVPAAVGTSRSGRKAQGPTAVVGTSPSTEDDRRTKSQSPPRRWRPSPMDGLNRCQPGVPSGPSSAPSDAGVPSGPSSAPSDAGEQIQDSAGMACSLPLPDPSSVDATAGAREQPQQRSSAVGVLGFAMPEYEDVRNRPFTPPVVPIGRLLRERAAATGGGGATAAAGCGAGGFGVLNGGGCSGVLGAGGGCDGGSASTGHPSGRGIAEGRRAGNGANALVACGAADAAPDEAALLDVAPSAPAPLAVPTAPVGRSNGAGCGGGGGSAKLPPAAPHSHASGAVGGGTHCGAVASAVGSLAGTVGAGCCDTRVLDVYYDAQSNRCIDRRGGGATALIGMASL